MNAKIPRGLERYPLGTKIEGPAERWEATDRERGRDVTVSRVTFGLGRHEERDAFVERVRALYVVTHPALVAALDAGPWEDDAFVVEERVVEPQPVASAPLDAREKALAARAIADGLSTLHEAGWALSSLDVVVDAYRQPKIGMARYVVPATDEARARDVAAAASLVQQLAPGTATAGSARDLAGAVVVPDAGPPTPLVHASPPPAGSSWGILGLVGLVIAVAIALVMFRGS